MNTHPIDLYLDVLDNGDGHTMKAVVEFNTFPASFGRRDHGLQMEPDEPAELEIVNVFAIGKKNERIEISALLSDEQLSMIEDAIMEAREPA